MSTIFNNTLDKRTYLVVQDSSKGYALSGSMGTLDPLILDATTDVSVTYSTDVTTYFVNSGTDNSDHMKNQPRTISFSGVISNDLGLSDFISSLRRTNSFTNIVNIGVSTTTSGSVITDGNPATLYHETMKQAMEGKSLFSVYVPNIGVIHNCVVTKCGFSTNNFTFNAFSVSLELKEIRIPPSVELIPSFEVENMVAVEQTQATSSIQKVSAPEIAPSARSSIRVPDTVIQNIQNIQSVQNVLGG